MARPVISLVLPIYNEEEVIPELHTQLQAFLEKLQLDAEVVFVNDGSKDLSFQILRGVAAADPRYRILSFARNFGHQTAVTAGLDYARGQAVVVMDADLQDPPEVVLEMVQKWREGFDVVYGQRATRVGETAFKLFTAKVFYRLFAKMIPIEVPLDTGDFRLMSRRVVIALRELREAHRFVRGMVSWIGFRQTAVLYDRPARFAGETKYPLRKMLRFAVDGITSFSVVPLRLSTYLGFFISFMSVLVALWAMFVHFILSSTVPGWTAQVVITSLLASVQLVMIGILGEYVGRIYEQVKQRPLYVVGDRVNLGPRDDDELDETDIAPALAVTGPSGTSASVPPKTGTIIGMQATGDKAAPMQAAPAPSPFPPFETPPIVVPPPMPLHTAAMPALPNAAAKAPPPASKTAPMAALKPTTAEVPTVPQPTAEIPTMRSDSAFPAPSTRSTTKSFPPAPPQVTSTPQGPASVRPRPSAPPAPASAPASNPSGSGPASSGPSSKPPVSRPMPSTPPPLPVKKTE
jgi:polyisoprenyl-phosphate glycosyltransferase